MSKLNVLLDIDGFEPKPFSHVDHIAQVSLGAFDPRAYLALPATKQAEVALGMMLDGMRVLCEQLELEAPPFEAAAAATAEIGFEVTFEFKKLCKWHSSRKVRGEVLVTYRAGGTDVDLALSTRSGGRVSTTRMETGGRWPAVWFDWFKSHWEGESFVVANRTGQVTARLDDVLTLVAKKPGA